MRTYIVLLCLLIAAAATAQTTGSRLIGTANYNYTGASRILLDSTMQEWLAGYGGDEDHEGDPWKTTLSERLAYNATSGAIVNGSKNITAFDANSNIATVRRTQWDGTAYQNTTLSTDSVGANGKVAKTVVQKWVAGAWENDSYKVFTYNAAGQATLTETWYWQPGSSSYVLSHKLVQVFNAAGKQTLYESTYLSAGTWVNQDQLILTYNANNQRLTETTLTGSGTAWVNLSRYAYQYDGSNNLEIRTYYTWNTTTNVWQNIRRTVYTYNAQNLAATYIVQDYSTTWNNLTKVTYTYNTQNLVDITIVENWTTGSWVNAYKSIKQYNGNGFLLEDLTQQWDGTVWADALRSSTPRNTYDQKLALTQSNYIAGSWELDAERYFYYETYTTSGIADADAGIGANVYPNPFTINTIVDIEQPQNGKAVISIYNLQGALVKQAATYFPAGHNTWLWDGNSSSGDAVESGMYFIHIQSAGKFGAQKVVKL